MDFPHNSVGRESTCNVGDLGLIPGLGQSPAEGKSYLLRYSGLENSMDCVVLGVAESDMTEWPSCHLLHNINKRSPMGHWTKYKHANFANDSMFCGVGFYQFTGS